MSVLLNCVVDKHYGQLLWTITAHDCMSEGVSVCFLGFLQHHLGVFQKDLGSSEETGMLSLSVV